MKQPPKRTGNDTVPADKRAYRAPVLQYFGAVTDLTNSAIGTCSDDSDSNNCGGPNQNMEMRIA